MNVTQYYLVRRSCEVREALVVCNCMATDAVSVDMVIYNCIQEAVPQNKHGKSVPLVRRMSYVGITKGKKSRSL